MPKKYATRKTLIIVESPAKCKKIEEYLGPGYKCLASFGHLRELPSLQHIDVNNDYQPSFQMVEAKKKQIELLKKEINSVDEVILACDADREGEAICFHLCELFGLSIERTKRIVFHEITETALLKAIQHPRIVDMNLVESQQSRQILDLIVGFNLSPLLWKYISSQAEHSLSAGRCQTPALKLIYENQQEINDDLQKKVYRTTGYFTNLNLPFSLDKEYETEDQVTDFLFGSTSYKHEYSCSKPEKVFKKPPEPLITSTLQQKASNEFHYSPKETMKICQQLYEGGYITYMRTDSKVYSEEFIDSMKKYVKNQWDETYLSPNVDSLISRKKEEETEPNTQSKKEKKVSDSLAQEAHEAIRPTQLILRELPTIVTDTKQRKMYQLIWETTLESCMAPAIFYSLCAKISAFDQSSFRYSSELINFPGWKIVTKKYSTENKEFQYLQTIAANYILSYKKMVSKVTMINTKSHYTEARLVQLLEEKGIGRPSTFSNLIDKIQERGYVKKENIQGKTVVCKDFELEGDEIVEMETKREFGNEKNKLVIQTLGIMVTEFLLKYFSPLFEYDYTKQMEEELDEIAQGKKTRHQLCRKCNEEVYYFIEQLKNSQETKKEYKIDEDHTFLVGKYGPVIKCVEKNDAGKEIVTFKPVKKDMDLHKLQQGEYSLDEVIQTETSKKSTELVVGLHNDEKVMLKKGKFGLYITWGKNTKTLKEFGNRPLESIRFEEIQKYLEEGSNMIREISDHMSIRKGPKGDYLFFKTAKMKKPQFYSLRGCKEDYKTCDLFALKQWLKETYQLS
jgi:DNA topoisomerase-1